MNVRQAVDEFISRLELTDAEQTEASRQHTYLRDGLASILDIDPEYNTFLTGSYSRNTAIRPLKDIDVFCVLTRTDQVDPMRLAPVDALNKIRRALESLYHDKVATLQARSVNIEFTGTGIGYDIVPAFADKRDRGEVFLIPDMHRYTWIRSNPRVHKQKSIDANERAGKELKPLTKAIKHWNRQQPEKAQLRSFHIEVMAWDVLREKPQSRLEGLRTLFAGLATRVTRSTSDPAGLGPDLDGDMSYSDRSTAEKRFNEAACSIAEAMRLAADGKIDAAHYVLNSLFGDAFPKR